MQSKKGKIYQIKSIVKIIHICTVKKKKKKRYKKYEVAALQFFSDRVNTKIKSITKTLNSGSKTWPRFLAFMALLTVQLKRVTGDGVRERESDTQQRDPGWESNLGPLQSLSTWDARSAN